MLVFEKDDYVAVTRGEQGSIGLQKRIYVYIMTQKKKQIYRG